MCSGFDVREGSPPPRTRPVPRGSVDEFLYMLLEVSLFSYIEGIMLLKVIALCLCCTTVAVSS